MKTFIVSCVVAAILAGGAAVILNKFQEPVSQAFLSPTSVRL